MNKILIYLFLIFTLASCRNEDEAPSVSSGKTVLVYMVADNSLSTYVDNNIAEMREGMKGSPLNSKLIIYVDKLNSAPQLIKIENDNGTINEKVVKNYQEQNSVSPNVMASVISDVVKKYPAQSYGLVLWSHGYGWIPGGSNTKAISTRWFGQDDTKFMDIPDLVTALNTGPHFDYILFDACFMGGVESSYALRKNASYLIASPAEVLGDGFPYKDIVPYFFGSTEADYIKISALYYNHYKDLTITSNEYPSAAIGCIKCSELDSLAAQTAKIITAHHAPVATINASGIQHFEGYSPHLFYDLGDFINAFATNKERLSFEQQLNKAVIYKACTPIILSVTFYGDMYITINTFSGLNTFIPQTETSILNKAYKSCEWYNAAGWNCTN